MNDSIYLDHNTIGRPSADILETFYQVAKEYWGLLSSPHFIGQQQIYPIQKSLDRFCGALGVEEQDELFINSGGAEGVYHVYSHVYRQVARQTGKTLFLTSQVEEMATVLSLKQMEELGCVGKYLLCNERGQITREIAEKAMTARTAVLSISWANGLTGVIQPIADLANLCREKNVLFHVDISAVWGKRFLRFCDLDISFLTLDGPSIQAPPNTGLVIAKKGIDLSSFIPGKGEGATACFVSLAQAVYDMGERFEQYCMEVSRLRDRLEEGIERECPQAVVLFKESDRLPNCTAIAFRGVYSEALLYQLNARGVYATRGGGRFQMLEDMLLSMGLSQDIACSALSFSLSWDTTEEEIEEAIDRIGSCVRQLRACLPKEGGGNA